jgi:hypothetical protein
MRLIIVEKNNHQPTKNRRRRLMIKQNVGDGLARPDYKSKKKSVSIRFNTRKSV